MILLRVPKALKKHKRKIYITVLLITGGYLAVKWAIRSFKSNYLLQSKQKYLCRKKLEHFYTIQQTADEATFTLLKSLHESIKKCLNNEGLIEELKQKPKNKLEIWEQLKVMCITRCLTTTYAISILVLCIKVILNIIGGYMYIINVSNSKHQKIELSQSVQQKFLENIELFIKNGLPKLVYKLNALTELHFKEIPLKENLTVSFIEKKFQEIITTAEESNEFYLQNTRVHSFLNDTNKDNGELGLVRDSERLLLKSSDFNFMTVHLFEDFYHSQASNPSNCELENVNDAQVLRALNLEAFDVLSCDDSLTAFNSLKLYIFEFFINNLTQEIIQQTSTNEKCDGLIQISTPFAKLIPLMDKMFDRLFKFEQNDLINDVLANKLLNKFSANIYESFSYSNED